MSEIFVSVFSDQNFTSAFLQTIIIILLGFIFRRKNIIAKEGKSVVTTLVWKLSVPCFAFNAFMQDFDTSSFVASIKEFSFAFIFYIILIFLGTLIFYRQEKNTKILSGLFMAIGQTTLFSMPILQSVYDGRVGQEQVLLYISVISIVFRIFVYIVGFTLISGEKITFSNLGSSLKKIFLTPIMIGMFAGIAVFLLQTKLPFLRIDRSLPVAYVTVKSLARLLSPLAMFLIGLSLGESKFSDCFKDINAWIVAFLRNFVAPVVVLCLCILLHKAGIIQFTEYSLISLVIAFSAPISITLSVMCMQFNHDEVYASRACLISTLFTIVSMPLMFVLTYWAYGLINQPPL